MDRQVGEQKLRQHLEGAATRFCAGQGEQLLELVDDDDNSRLQVSIPVGPNERVLRGHWRPTVRLPPARRPHRFDHHRDPLCPAACREPAGRVSTISWRPKNSTRSEMLVSVSKESEPTIRRHCSITAWHRTDPMRTRASCDNHSTDVPRGNLKISPRSPSVALERGENQSRTSPKPALGAPWRMKSPAACCTRDAGRGARPLRSLFPTGRRAAPGRRRLPIRRSDRDEGRTGDRPLRSRFGMIDARTSEVFPMPDGATRRTSRLRSIRSANCTDAASRPKKVTASAGP